MVGVSVGECRVEVMGTHRAAPYSPPRPSRAAVSNAEAVLFSSGTGNELSRNEGLRRVTGTHLVVSHRGPSHIREPSSRSSSSAARKLDRLKLEFSGTDPAAEGPQIANAIQFISQSGTKPPRSAKTGWVTVLSISGNEGSQGKEDRCQYWCEGINLARCRIVPILKETTLG